MILVPPATLASDLSAICALGGAPKVVVSDTTRRVRRTTEVSAAAKVGPEKSMGIAALSAAEARPGMSAPNAAETTRDKNFPRCPEAVERRGIE
jgi:hypothetical protein